MLTTWDDEDWLRIPLRDRHIQEISSVQKWLRNWEKWVFSRACGASMYFWKLPQNEALTISATCSHRFFFRLFVTSLPIKHGLLETPRFSSMMSPCRPVSTISFGDWCHFLHDLMIQAVNSRWCSQVKGDSPSYRHEISWSRYLQLQLGPDFGTADSTRYGK